jgi:hypothetical protein
MRLSLGSPSLVVLAGLSACSGLRIVDDTPNSVTVVQTLGDAVKGTSVSPISPA